MLNLETMTFHRTWCVNQGKGKATVIPPTHLKGQQDYLWKWRIPIAELDQILLVRDVILTAKGKLLPSSLSLAAGFQIAHHEGAGGDCNPDAMKLGHQSKKLFLSLCYCTGLLLHRF
jgi:hypothetical protein